VEAEYVPGGQDDADASADRHRDEGGPGTEHDQELADETVQTGQPERGQRDDEEEGGKQRGGRRQALELGTEARAGAALDHADHEEERGDDHTVVDHLDQRPLDPQQVAGEDPEPDEPEVTHRGVGDQALQVGLHQRHEGAVKDADGRQDRQRTAQAVRRIREERQVEAQKAIGAEFRDQTREDDHDRDRRRGICRRQPGVQREDRHLDREGEAEPDEEQLLDADGPQPGRQMPDTGRGMLDQHRPVEAELPGLGEVDRRDRQNRDQHREAADHRIDQEFKGRVDPPPLPPDADQEIKRNQHRPPEDIEKDEIQRQQDAGGRGLEDQQQQDELLEPRHERIDDDDRQQEEQRIEPQQEEAEAVDPQVVADARGGDPSQRFLELQVEIADPLLESTDDRHHQHQRDDGAEHPELLDDASGFPRGQRHQQSTGERDHQGERQPGDTGGQRVPAHPPSLTGRYPRKAATTTTTPIAPPSVQSA